MITNLPPAAPSPDDPSDDTFAPSNSPRWFVETRWSRVLRAQHGSEEAMKELARDYHRPLVNHALRFPMSQPDAEDLVQDFFHQKFWSSIIPRSQQDRGKLRTFLLKAFNQFRIDDYRRKNAVGRGGGSTVESLDAENPPAVADASQDADAIEAVYDRDWAIAIWERAFDALSHEWTRANKGEKLTILLQHGIISRNPHKLASPDYDRLAADLGKSRTALGVMVHDLRKELRTLLIEEVRQTLVSTGSPEQDAATLKDEFTYLLRVLYNH